VAAVLRSLLLPGLAAALAAQAPQAPTAAFKLIPASATEVEFTWRLEESNKRFLAATASLGTKSDLVNLEGRAHLSLADLATGAVVDVHFENPKVAAKGAKPLPKARRWSVLMVPVKDGKRLAARLQAKATGSVQRYEWTTEQGPQERFLAFRGGYAFVAEGRDMLELALKPGPSLEAELKPLATWLTAHDTVLLVTERTVHRAIEEALMEHPSKAASPALSAGPFKELGELARTSVRHAALALDVPEDGSLRFTARAFFRPHSPLAAKAASLPPLQGHPLGGLPDGPYALALGGRWPLPMAFFEKVAGQYPGLDPKDREQLVGLMAKVQEQQLGMAARFRGTAKGEPLLQGLTGLVELKDGQAWLAAVKQQLAWCQEHFKGVYTYQEGVLPDLPSLTVSIDFGRLAGGKELPPQVGMVAGMLLGGMQLTISQALVDGHEAVYAFGGKEALRRAVDEVLLHTPLAASPKLKAIDLLLPKETRFSLYLDPSGVRAMLTTLMAAFTNKEPNLPEVADTLPLAGALAMDPGGIQFSGSARPESLEAMVKLFSGLSKAMPGQKQGAEGPVRELPRPEGEEH
jgi:hypothetical protein